MALYIGKSRNRPSNDGGVSIPLSLVGWVRRMGFSETNPLSWLREAVYYSAPITHADGNRRYGELLLTVKGNKLLDLALYAPNCEECNDTKEFVVREACSHCDGECDMDLCRDVETRKWPCQACTVVDKPEPVRHNKGSGRKKKSRRYNNEQDTNRLRAARL